MIIEKTFWYKDTPTTKQAFSYDNDKNVPKFVKQYGGKMLPSLLLSDFVAENIPPNTEVYSVLVNEKPVSAGSGPSDMRRFKVLVKAGSEWSYYDQGHTSLREANTVAKSITKNYELVIVVKENYVEDEAIEEELYDPVGAMI
jgi:hypothetical protein